jgi:hypothetical protein
MLAAADKLRLWREKPHVFVREVFGATPDGWQDEALEIFPTQPRIAMKACKGPGKTCLLAWLCWNFLLTRPHPKIAATAISGDNLKDNLWPEMATWQNKSALLKDQFSWHAERIICKAYPETWWMSARTWSRSATPEQQGNTLAGLHAPYVMIVLDESGGIPDAVMANAEGIGSSAEEWHIVQAGNPTHLAGPLYRACTTERSIWHVIEITSDPDNPKRTSRVSMQWAREQIMKYGIDHPWVLVNVMGKFPPASFNALIGPDEVNAVLGKHLQRGQYVHAAKTIGIDVARFGDDISVLFPRQGMATWKPQDLRNVDGNFGAGATATMWNQHPGGGEADGVFIDGTGGWAASWVDALSLLHRVPIQVQFAGKPNDPKYYNKRAEIWFEMCQAIKDGQLYLPNLPDIVAELTTPLYTFKGDKMLVEEKDQVKLRLGRSPNYADALATTFAQPVHVRQPLPAWMQRQAGRVQTEYDPFSSERI